MRTYLYMFGGLGAWRVSLMRIMCVLARHTSPHYSKPGD